MWNCRCQSFLAPQNCSANIGHFCCDRGSVYLCLHIISHATVCKVATECQESLIDMKCPMECQTWPRHYIQFHSTPISWFDSVLTGNPRRKNSSKCCQKVNIDQNFKCQSQNYQLQNYCTSNSPTPLQVQIAESCISCPKWVGSIWKAIFF